MIQIFCWLLPASGFKNRLLKLFGHDIHRTAHVGPNLVIGVSKFEIEEYARLGPFNVIRGVRLAHLGRYSMVESWSWITAHPIYRTVDENAGTLFMGVCARLGSRSYVDCSGTVVLRAFSALGGNRCFLQTHEPNFDEDAQTVGRVTLGHHSLVGSCAVLLKGAYLPDQSILAANSTMVRSSADEASQSGLYAGAPAKWRRELAGEWFTRNTYYTSGYHVDEPLGVRAEDRVFDDAEVVVDAAGQDELANAGDSASSLLRSDNFASRNTL